MSNLELVRVQVDQLNAGLRETLRDMPREAVAEFGLNLIARVQLANRTSVSFEQVVDAFALVGYANLIANMLEVDEASR